jgi:hypothetical protein
MDIEKTMAGSACRKAAIIVLLPPPEGDEKTNS